MSPIEEEGLGTPLLDPIDLLGSGVFTVPARVVGRAGGKILFSLGKHAARRMAEAEVTEKMIEVALRKGDKYWDPTNRVTNYVLEQGFASGKSLLVGQNPVTGKITTVIKGRDLVSPRFIPLK